MAAITPRWLAAVERKYVRASPNDIYSTQTQTHIKAIISSHQLRQHQPRIPNPNPKPKAPDSRLTTSALTVSPNLNPSPTLTLSPSVIRTSEALMDPSKSCWEEGGGRLLMRRRERVAWVGVRRVTCGWGWGGLKVGWLGVVRCCLEV